MKIFVYAYYSKVVSAYQSPIFSQFDKDRFVPQLTRMVMTTSSDETLLGLQDLDLYWIGLFDDQTGLFDSLVHPEWLISCSSLLERRKQALIDLQGVKGQGPEEVAKEV